MWVQIALMLVAVMGPRGASRSTVVSVCGGRVAVPHGWVLISSPAAKIEGYDEPDDICAFGLRPAKWPPADVDIDVGRFAVEVHIRTESLEDAAPKAFFERVGDLRKEWSAPDLDPSRKPSDWVVLGRQSSRNPAWKIKTKYWHGLRGDSDIGYSGVNGYSGLGIAQRAAITNGRLTALFFADNPYTQEEFDRIVRSFRFPPRGR